MSKCIERKLLGEVIILWRNHGDIFWKGWGCRLSFGSCGGFGGWWRRSGLTSIPPFPRVGFEGRLGEVTSDPRSTGTQSGGWRLAMLSWKRVFEDMFLACRRRARTRVGQIWSLNHFVRMCCTRRCFYQVTHWFQLFLSCENYKSTLSLLKSWLKVSKS